LIKALGVSRPRDCELTAAPTKRIKCLDAPGETTQKRESPMARVLIFVYAAVTVCFLRAHLQRPTAAGVFLSLLWPVALALGLAWLMMLDDDALSL
jgi:hypothetical protein